MLHRNGIPYFVMVCVCWDLVNAITPYQTLREVGLAVAGRTGEKHGLKRAASLDIFGANHEYPADLKILALALDKLVTNTDRLPKARRYSGNTLDKLVQPQLPKDMPFSCDVTLQSPSTATSVHRLRPGDIAAIGALGDSIMAGLGLAATFFHQLLTENRGLTWAAGGQGNWRSSMTLPNLLREFNPNLVGAASGDSLEHHRTSGFNVAATAAMSTDLPYMASQLVKRMTSNDKINITNDWKMITIFIGNNDICSDICYHEDMLKRAEQHRVDLVKTLRILRDRLPRTFVNVVPIPDLIQLTRFTGAAPKPMCALSHMIECPCLFGPARASRRSRLPAVIAAWQNVQKEVTFMDEFNDKDDFTVVFQPFSLHSTIPKIRGKTDYTFLSKDCFHFSQKSNARVANAIWNNLLEPVGQKTTKWLPTFEKILCPTPERPFFFTNKNSLQYNTTAL